MNLNEHSANESNETFAEELRRLVREESVMHLDDWILRRTGWGDDPRGLAETAEKVVRLLGWTEKTQDNELSRVLLLSSPNRVLSNV